jgi:hypothetical protein
MAERRGDRMNMHHLPPRVGAAALLLFGSVGVAACADPNAVRVRLQSYTRASLDPNQVALRAQVAGPLAGLRYKWFAVAGQSAPQVGDTAETVFTFADGAPHDRVTLEVWRADRRVARAELDVAIDSALARTSAHVPKLTLAFTKVPPSAAGGPDTRSDIAGRVAGELTPDLRVVVYARAGDVWYIQPSPDARLVIAADGTWRSWTHTGTSYAALVARPGFVALPRYDVLPQVGGWVVARTVVDGAER